jgi:outer membrane protein TolC
MREVADEARDVASRHRDQIAEMLRAGLSSERDLKAAEADLAEAEQGWTRARNGVALAESNLNRLLGRPAGASIGPLESEAPPADAGSLEDLCRQAEERRPELNLLREGIRAARAGAVLARTQDKPSVAARATAARQTASAFVDRDYFAGGFVLTWKLLDGGKTRLDAREADARCAELRAQLDDAVLGVRLEVEKAWRDMRDARARIAAADRQIESARAALAISEARYEARMATQLEVSGSTLAVTRARGNREEAVHDLLAGLADLRHALALDISPLPADAAPSKVRRK